MRLHEHRLVGATPSGQSMPRKRCSIVMLPAIVIVDTASRAIMLLA
jgi:hypothetical protein